MRVTTRVGRRASRGKERVASPAGLGSHPRALPCRHQRLYSLLDRLRLATAPGSRGPAPLVTAHPLDGDGPLALETVSPDKVSARSVHAGPRGSVRPRAWGGGGSARGTSRLRQTPAALALPAVRRAPGLTRPGRGRERRC